MDGNITEIKNRHAIEFAGSKVIQKYGAGTLDTAIKLLPNSIQ